MNTISLKQVLLKINFVERYKKLRLKHQSSKRFRDYEKENVRSILKEIGYSSRFVRNGEFFMILEKEGDYTFQYNICLKGGIVELILDVQYKEQHCDPIGPFDLICRNLDVPDKIFLATFANYEELREILTEAVNIFKDIKHETLLAELK